ncbi:MFS transporter [Nocardia sp. 348MFTsu5.1]|uniref:MFS transporter n=1 Tax=Nocardia sp. 348MFTsu5.1 TaxID=1172185 RepID=UPI00037EC168|nr:MFS transporter [Nocardia sp. 348MFTsu5.1]
MQTLTVNTETAPRPSGRRVGGPGYRRTTLTLFAAGMGTFMTLYCVQGLLPIFSDHYGVSPAMAALAVSVATGLLAFAIVPASLLSERFGRVRVMCVAAVSASVLGLVLPWSPTFEVLLAGRALQGLLCAGVPAVAMAYLAEEIDGRSLGTAMGTYVAGTTIGGLVGRMIPTLAVDLIAWQWALELASLVALGFAILFVRMIPPSNNFTPARMTAGVTLRNLAGHLRDVPLLCLFGLAFVLMGGFVTVYNFLGYRLINAPFDLPVTLAGLVFTLYLAGTISSAAAGRMSDAWGRDRVLVAALAVMIVGLVLSLPDWLPTVLIGILLFTAGFFAAHSVSSGWVGARATHNRAGASSLYMLCYYLGSAFVGAFGGIAFTVAGWAGIVGFVGLFLCAAIILMAILSRTHQRPNSLHLRSEFSAGKIQS